MLVLDLGFLETSYIARNKKSLFYLGFPGRLLNSSVDLSIIFGFLLPSHSRWKLTFFCYLSFRRW